MRVPGLVLGLIAAVLLAPQVALAAAAPAPDPAPQAPSAPVPDPVPGSSAPAAPTTAPPPAPVPADPSANLAAPSSTSTPPATEPTVEPTAPPRSRPKPRRRSHPEPAKRTPSERRVAPALPDLNLPALHLALSSSAKESGGYLAPAAIALLLLVFVGAVSLRLTLRLAGPLAVMLLLVPAVTVADAQTVAANCDTPGPARDGCERWYKTPWVSLTWAPDPGGMIASGCVNGLFTADWRRESRSCTVQWGGTVVRKEIWVGIDRTPPDVAGIQPTRPADFAGWFNKPISFAFQGSDATSGVAGCTTAAYSGPDGQGVSVSGSCTDVAGNSRSAAFPLNYDATPPGSPRVDAVPGAKRVHLDWVAPRDAVAVEVTRIAPGADDIVYQGRGRHVTDRRRRNGVRYRYRIAAIDRAGNRTSTTVTAVPTTANLLTPPRGGRLKRPPLLAWKRVKGASYYNVQVHRGGRKILSRWPKANRFRLHRAWRFAGGRRELVPGTYTWYVWPGFGSRAERRYGRLLGRRTFTVKR
jgi:hypothetical protein